MTKSETSTVLGCILCALILVLLLSLCFRGGTAVSALAHSDSFTREELSAQLQAQQDSAFAPLEERLTGIILPKAQEYMEQLDAGTLRELLSPRLIQWIQPYLPRWLSGDAADKAVHALLERFLTQENLSNPLVQSVMDRALTLAVQSAVRSLRLGDGGTEQLQQLTSRVWDAPVRALPAPLSALDPNAAFLTLEGSGGSTVVTGLNSQALGLLVRQDSVWRQLSALPGMFSQAKSMNVTPFVQNALLTACGEILQSNSKELEQRFSDLLSSLLR